jgi:uncharacterized protein YhaN
MRISALDLIAYGHFAGHRFEFGDKPGFHLIFGENEAGKSTTLRALSSVLFGYPHHVIDDFRHEARDMAIGAELVAKSGARLPVVRRRKGKAALTDGSQAIDEAAVAAFLGGVSREMFEMVFSLDHERLRQHADALLKDGGTLGFSLAEAGSGVGGLRSALDAIAEEREDLFLPSGQKPIINRLAKSLIRGALHELTMSQLYALISKAKALNVDRDGLYATIGAALSNSGNRPTDSNPTRHWTPERREAERSYREARQKADRDGVYYADPEDPKRKDFGLPELA